MAQEKDEWTDDSEDEDYKPTAERGDKSDSDEEASVHHDSGDEKTVDKNIALDKSTTRSGLAVKGDESVVPSAQSNGTNVDALWAAMNAPAAEQQKQVDVEMVTITRRYEFAGKTHEETKVVPKDSREAKEYAAATATETAANKEPSKPVSASKPLRKVMKRKSMLEANHAQDKARKINTLEKSRMEWSSFVDKEGINEDLKRANENGYLDKQDFLKKSEDARYQQWKAGQKK